MKRVVIIGGGFAGATLARKLHGFDVTLIDTKDYFEFTPGILRTIIDPRHRTKVQRLHRTYLRNVHFKLGHVIDVTSTHVVLEDARVPYDYLAVCSGSTYSSPIKEADLVATTRAKDLIDAHKRLENANKILIVGGGIVGVELAAEIINAYPSKHVRIVHADSRLMPRVPPRAQEYVHALFDRFGVTLMLNERVVQGNGTHFVTDKGSHFSADIAFMCTGIQPNSTFMKKHFASAVNERNQIMVSPTLQVKGHPTMFALGDVNDIREEKLAQTAEIQAHIISHNLHALEKGMPLKRYTPSSRVIVVSLGKTDGMLIYKKWTFAGLLPGLLKGIVEVNEMRKY